MFRSAASYSGRTFGRAARFISSSVRAVDREAYLQKESDALLGVTSLVLNRPHARNALGIRLMVEFRECLIELNKSVIEGETRVVVVKSDVDRVFCSGADLKERAKMSSAETAVFVAGLRNGFTQLEKLQAPTIASINGFALGGGLELALCCDFRVAGHTATMGLIETSLAIIPGAGGTQRLPRLLGVAKAKELIYTAKRLSASEALQCGLVTSVKETSDEAAFELAKKILPQGPVALRMAKAAIDRGISQDIQAALGTEELCYAQVIPTEDRLEALSAFREKRTPSFKGR